MSSRGTVVLVEGHSDRVAVETLARCLGRDLAADGVRVRELGGATNVARALVEELRVGPGLRVAGLYDEAEERFFARGLVRAGLGPVSDRVRLEQLGFFACVADLEDELIRALGELRTLDVVEEQGELTSFLVLQQQPAQRDRSQHDQLRRFLGTRSGRKSVYARALVEALVPADVPRPLRQLLDRV